jgi:hypothetical protein
MGDRTYVILTVLAQHADIVRSYEDQETCNSESPSTEGKLMFFHYEEVNYGELRFRHELRKQGVPYDSAWDAGSDYGAGTEYCRFTPEGEVDVKEVYDCDQNPGLVGLLQHIDCHKDLKKYILDHQERVTPLPWDNQEQYGKLYRAACLIKPPQE